jgi:hypothetical protein
MYALAVSHSKDTVSSDKLAYTTGLEEDIVAKEGRYVFSPSSLDSWVTCRIVGVSGVMHWDSRGDHLMHTSRGSIVACQILRRSSRGSLGKGVKVLRTSMMMVGCYDVFKMNENIE